jgi:glycosyltransferase involved in cell wall biosynthesis
MNLFPTVTIVTPSLNQGKYIESAISSVIMQEGDFYIDYIIMDGGSKDNSISIIRKYDEMIKSGQFRIKCRGINYSWLSAIDNGQYDAINRGVKLSAGEIMGWINSDDMYLPSAFKTIVTIFQGFKQVDWITANPTKIDKDGMIIDVVTSGLYPKILVAKGVFNGRDAHFIQQESTFWRRSLWDQIEKKLDASYKYASDYELWTRFAAMTELVKVKTQLGCFRKHNEQKTMDRKGYDKEVDFIKKVALTDKLFIRITRLLSKIYLLDKICLLYNHADIIYYCHKLNKWQLKTVRGLVVR